MCTKCILLFIGNVDFIVKCVKINLPNTKIHLPRASVKIFAEYLPGELLDTSKIYEYIRVISCYSVIPLLRDSVGVLMQRQPRSLDQTLPGCYQRVSSMKHAHLSRYGM